MMAADKSASNQNEPDQYKQATQEVVDDAMRTDVLGPNMVKVLNDHTPANAAIQAMIAKAITDDPDAKNIKKALEQFLKDYDNKRKGVWIDRAIWLIIGAAVVGAITYFANFLPKP